MGMEAAIRSNPLRELIGVGRLVLEDLPAVEDLIDDGAGREGNALVLTEGIEDVRVGTVALLTRRQPLTPEPHRAEEEGGDLIAAMGIRGRSLCRGLTLSL
jgi:hypothetical protein